MFLYVANWKMNMPYNKVIHFCKLNYDGFLRIHNLPQKKVVLCPEFTSIKDLDTIFEKTYINIGAQDCSKFAFGSYTGQVPAESLKNIGCNFCIVGHSERRKYCGDTSGQIAQKVYQLLEAEITPIVCVGEKKEEYDSGVAKDIIIAQLEPVFEVVRAAIKPKICIAYEPIWSIGSGKVPEKAYIEEIFRLILDVSKKEAGNAEFKLLYGGSVDELTAERLRSLRCLNGFLIGGASLNFQKFEKIVNL